MEVPLLDLKAQLDSIRDEVKKAINNVIESSQYIMGPQVAELEKKIAAYCSASFAVGVSSGTDALLISLIALELQPDDLVITTPYSFFATAGVVARLRAVPVFIDIQPDTYNIDPQKLEEWFRTNPKKIAGVKAMIPVHLYGQCAEMDPLLDIAHEFEIPVIEDAAQAIGAQYPSSSGLKKAGTMGTLGCFSFFPSKNLGAMGDGGMVVTNDEILAGILVKLRNHGASPKYHHALIGGNFRLDTIQAAVLLVKFHHLEAWHRKRQENAAYYDAHLNIDGIRKPVITYQREYHIYNQYVISVPDKRDGLCAFLKEKRIGHEVYYPVPFHEQACFQYLGYRRGDFPNSEWAAAHTLALPIYPELTREMQDYVIDAIGRFYA